MHGLRSWLQLKRDVPANDATGLQYDSVDTFVDAIDYYHPDPAVLTKNSMNL